MDFPKLLTCFFFLLTTSTARATTVEVSCSQSEYQNFGIYLNGEWVDSFKFPITMDSTRDDTLRMSYCSACCGSYCGHPVIKTIFDSQVTSDEIKVYDHRSNQSFSILISQENFIYEADGRKAKCSFKKL